MKFNQKKIIKGILISYRPILNISFERQKAALGRFCKKNDSISQAVRSRVLYYVKDMNVDLDLEMVQKMVSIPLLNHGQQNAILRMFSKSKIHFISYLLEICLIQGPPGTGKTVTVAVFIIFQLMLGKFVLACASTNSATDTLLETVVALLRNKQLQQHLIETCKKYI